MKKVVFKDWIFYSKAWKTRFAYLFAEKSKNFVPCDCLDCQNLRAQIHTVFPPKIKQLFAKLGINYRKYAEHFLAETKPDGCLYYGWFHFKGRIEGPDWYQQSSEGESRSVFIPITADFALGVHVDNGLFLIGYDDDLVQLEFEAQIPWVLDVPSPQ